MIETTILDNIIVGRIDPHIYAFRTNTVPNYLKVGDTYRPISIRLKEWEQFFPKLEHLDNWEWVAKTKNEKYFRDFAIHYYLEEIKHLHRLQPEDIPNLPYYSREFFQNAKPEDIDEAILDIERKSKQVGGPYQFYSEERLPVTEHFERIEKYCPRPNQADTIERFVEARNQGRRNLLMYAVMRFGKSFTSMCCATEMKARTVLIVSAKADVKNEWKKTVESHIRFADYSFLDSAALLSDTKAITKLLKQGKCATIFLTLQDLMGDDIKDKHKDIFTNQIDLLIVDETHFGARAEEYGKILRAAELTNSQIKKELSNLDETLDDLEDSLELVKKLKVDTTLHLSGTPYRILMGSEFQTEDIIAFYQFTDIIDDKEKWDREHLSDEDAKEWDNPYYGFPQMVRFAFNPNESARQMLEQMKAQGKTASLTELFRPQSISKDTSSAKGHLHFTHAKEVLDLLQVIDGSKEDEGLLGFLDYQKLQDGSMCRHIVCVLPFCASCDALEKLINDNAAKFKNLSQYQIVNISGIVGNNYATPEIIKQKIKEHEAQGEKTITLTVNRMLTGSTVREWDTMLFLKDVSSPQEYDQAIFRLQNQYVKTFENENGDTICYNMKPQTLLVDFDPNRMFVMQEQKSKIYNVNTEDRGNKELEERIRKELRISPIIVINKGKLEEVQPTDVMDAVRKYSATRTVMDEAREIPTDFVLLQDPQIQLLIEKLDPINAKKGINIKPVVGEGTNYSPDDDDDSGKCPTPPNNRVPTAKPTVEKDDADKRLATYFAQILFFALLTDDEVRSLKEIIHSIKADNNNKRIARNVGLKSTSLAYLHRGLNPFILQDLDYKIQNINELAHDNSLEPLERVERALRKFGRLSISEIVTPSKVADDVVALLPKDGVDGETRFLDIASKQAEFACAIHRRFGESVRNNIVSLPTSSLTYEFTRKVYKLLELPLSNIISTFNSYDLIGKNQDAYKNILKNMKFNVVVGNPPYQKMDRGDHKSSSSSPIYDQFVNLANEITSKYTNIILPARWYVGGKGLDNFRNQMMNDKHILKLHDYANEAQVFSNVLIEGGICYFMRDKDCEDVCEITIHQGNSIETSRRYLKSGNSDVFLRYNISVKIQQKVSNKTNKYFSELVLPRKPFGIANIAPTELKSTPVNGGFKVLSLVNRKRTISYLRADFPITSGMELVGKYKIFISKADGAAGQVGNPIPANIIGKSEAGENNAICTETFLAIGPFETEYEMQNAQKYLKTMFLRFLVGIRKSKNMTAKTYSFVPMQDFTTNSDIDWSKTIYEIDEQLFRKYRLNKNEVAFIKKMINPMK